MLDASSPKQEEEQNPTPMLPDAQGEKSYATEQEIAELLDPEIRAQKMMSPPKPRDPRLPPAGTVIVKWYRGRPQRVEILEHTFTWRGRKYFVLSDVVQAIVKSQRDCYVFLGLTVPWPENEAKIRGRRLNQTTMVDLPATTEF